VLAQLDTWRRLVEQTGGQLPSSELDDLVQRFAVPALEHVDSPLIGAGFIGDESTSGEGLRFAWWLGPLGANPLFGETTVATRLDITARGYAEYVNDFAALEWYRVPQSTKSAHVTGPYVDHLCTCDYILTVTTPVLVDGRMFGVVGSDIFVQRLERAVIPALLAVGRDIAVVNEEGRVVVSTSVEVAVGAILDEPERSRDWVTHPCSVVPFSVLVARP
jgi:hypothetical protein